MAIQRTIARRIPSGESSRPSTAPQPSRTEKCVLYSKPSYEVTLKRHKSFLCNSKLGVARGSYLLCNYLLLTDQPLPEDCLFKHSDTFEKLVHKVRVRNEARVLRNITPLVVPSVETLAFHGATELQYLTEGVNEA